MIISHICCLHNDDHIRLPYYRNDLLKISITIYIYENFEENVVAISVANWVYCSVSTKIR